MFMDDTKKRAGAIIASMSGSMAKKPSKDGAEQDSSAGHDAAASEIMDAVHSKNPAALKEALKSFVSMCMDEESSDSPTEGADDTEDAAVGAESADEQ